MRLRQIAVSVADVWVQPNGFKSCINQITVDEDLSLTLDFTRIAKNECEVATRTRR